MIIYIIHIYIILYSISRIFTVHDSYIHSISDARPRRNPSMLASARAPRGPSIGILHGLLSGASQVLDKAAWRIITWMRSNLGLFWCVLSMFYPWNMEISSTEFQRSWFIGWKNVWLLIGFSGPGGSAGFCRFYGIVWFYRRMVGKDMS